MLQLDDATAAERSSRFVECARAAQFWDPSRASSHAVERTLGYPDKTTAWDVYLVWPAGVRWKTTLPAPAYVLAQVGSTDGTVVVAPKGSFPAISATITESLGTIDDPVGRPDDLAALIHQSIERARSNIDPRSGVFHGDDYAE